MPDQPVANTKPPVDETGMRAKQYEQRRFEKRTHTRRIDRWEKDLARRVFAMTGPDVHILDAPCGTGRFLDVFLPARELSLLDRWEPRLEVCRERVAGKPNCKTILADMTAIPMADNSVDLVWCMRLFHHLPTDELRKAIFSEMARVSSRYVAMTFYNSWTLRHMRRKLMGSKFRGQYTTYKNIVAIAASVGLEVVERKPAVNIIQAQCFVLFKKKA